MSGRQSRDQSGELMVFLVGLALAVAGPVFLIQLDTGRSTSLVPVLLGAVLFQCGVVVAAAAVVAYVVRNYTAISVSSVGRAGILFFVSGVVAVVAPGVPPGLRFAAGPALLWVGSTVLVAAGALRVIGE